MIERNLGQIAEMLGGSLCDPNYKDVKISGVSTDSRTIQENNLYIPLVGEVFDGRLFVKECEDKGASAFLIDRDYEIKNNISIPYIRVDDTLKALQDLARSYRKELNVKVIGITGSNGKTTTKDLLYEVLSTKYKTQKTIGNLNNEIGVPKTILSLNEDTEIAVVELGTDKFGDISLTSNIALPDIAIITNIGDSHLHNLKSKEGILKAKMEIVEGLSDDGIFIYNGDDETMKKEIDSYKVDQKIISFGLEDDNDFVVKEIPSTPAKVSFSHDGETYDIPLLGRHNIYNGACCLLIANILGLDTNEVKSGLVKVRPANNRSSMIELDGFDVLDDSYKSNPQSLRSGLATCKLLDGYNNKIVVLGDMLELGDKEDELHYEVGLDIDPKDIHYCLFFGDLSYHMYKGALNNFPKDRAFHFTDKDDLIDKLKSFITKSTLVFVKGSHGMHMEEIIESIRSLKL
ncbi:UDP-N-acetylmuramoyl-tripeptide--D-alanyl-D-alanine ligase [Anaerococcus prevotii]|uniref:UDP-N-acetylmuramoyl-tripeptide--D-alanyl-D-alanine ligase n=1 Tax=Anaerococcus prevotii ACS-065-V-Col13 TaxID=879305 RepID=F0GTR0_9FIRM|nr:UDP-N-acetylmuramoyl-tripeptide--D-alanyl-D-alanine ligase [Anaerococcus prevotii]EGC82834.1 UDP-N-acetylmuramoyl-tripeptide--D-alanyl-D-alanine ligase [Anaerococcus prevotii ACS-065-V-Col13]